jgi:hypothetical protein
MVENGSSNLEYFSNVTRNSCPRHYVSSERRVINSQLKSRITLHTSIRSSTADQQSTDENKNAVDQRPVSATFI